MKTARHTDLDEIMDVQRRLLLLAGMTVVVAFIAAAIGLAVAAATPGAVKGRISASSVASAPGLVVQHGDHIYVEGKRVTRGSGPVVSRDGKRIAFTRLGRIYLADRGGGNSERILEKPLAHSLAWSPDGRTIAFVSANDVYTVPSAGGNPRKVTHSTKPWIMYTTPAFSPDGKTIALAASTDAFNADIFLLRNGKLTRLTHTQGTHDKLAEEHGPSFSPDGKRIVFVSNRAGSFDLFSIGVDGRGERRLTHTRGRDEDLPRWSSDGRRILYVYGQRVAHLSPAGTNVRELGDGTRADWR
jgi:Tol biopolymer transport system component